MLNQSDRSRLKELGLRSRALWNTARTSAVLGAGSVLAVIAGVSEGEAANRQRISHASHIAETALSNHLVEYGAIGAGGSIALGVTALVAYIHTSEQDWANATRAREAAQSSNGLTA